MIYFVIMCFVEQKLLFNRIRMFYLFCLQLDELYTCMCQMSLRWFYYCVSS
ncbi:MAG: hypothetical protein RIS29_2295, partial [Bacteroidota bacterium]